MDPPHSCPPRSPPPPLSSLSSSCSSHIFSFRRRTPPLRLIVQTVALHIHSVKGVSAPALALFAAVIFLNSLLSLLLLSGEMSQRVIAYVVIDGFTDLFFSFFIVICKVSRPNRFPSSHNEMRSITRRVVPLAPGVICSKRALLHLSSAWSLPRVLTRFALSPTLPPQMLPSSFSSTRTMIRSTFRWRHSTRWCSAR